MAIDNILYEYNPWWDKGFAFAQNIRREQLLAKAVSQLETRDIVMLTGLRRVGKTVIMKSMIEDLITEKSTARDNCLYVSMDDFQLKGFSLADIIDAYRTLKKLSIEDKVFVFFDEITYLEDFQIQLKNIYDKGNVKCVVSSSSSSILKDDSAYLTGRKKIIEISPLDFDEYLLFKKISLNKADHALKAAHFFEYMQTGGMPEYVLRGGREYLAGLIDDIIMKDIVAHHKIRNASIVRDFFVLLMERAGKQVSINKIANILKISPDTANRYLELFEQTYLIHLVSRHGKTNETLLSSKKVYATDVGMRNVTVGFRDKGAIFENIVFMKIKHKKPYYVNFEGQEIDFIIDQTLIEVKYLRELEGKQLDAFKAYPAANKVVITGIDDLEKFLTMMA